MIQSITSHVGRIRMEDGDAILDALISQEVPCIMNCFVLHVGWWWRS